MRYDDGSRNLQVFSDPPPPPSPLKARHFSRSEPEGINLIYCRFAAVVRTYEYNLVFSGSECRVNLAFPFESKLCMAQV